MLTFLLCVCGLLAATTDVETSPDFFRRTVGLKALPKDASAVESPTGLPSDFVAAREAACEDVRLYREVEVLAFELIGKGGAVNETEGRRARHYLAHLPVANGDLDLIRLELLAYRKRLELLLGKTPSAVELPDGKVLNIVKAPPAAELTAFKPVAVNFGGKYDLGSGVAFSVGADFSNFSVDVSGTSAKPLGKDGWPGGEIRVRLWIPGKEKGVWCPYRFAVNLDERPWKPMADGTGDYTRYFGIVRRIPDPARASRFTCEQVRTYDENHPRINVSYPYGFKLQRDGAKWSFPMLVFSTDLYGFWPSCRNRVKDVWYLEVTGCGKDVKVKLEWPEGRASNFNRFANAMAYYCLTPCYVAARDAAVWRWEASENEKLFALPPVSGDVFNAGDLESDRLFRAACLDPLLAANENLEKVTHCEGNQDQPKIKAESDAVKGLVFPKLGQLLYFNRELERARKDYLLQRFAGKRPTPKVVKKGESKDVAAPTLDEGDTIKLDDEEF